MIMNPYQLPVANDGRSPISRAKMILAPIIREHMPDFDKALEGRIAEDPVARCRAHTMLRIAYAASHQAAEVVRHQLERNSLFSGSADTLLSSAFEATTAQSTLVANITSFITQLIHLSLDIYPRLLAPNFVSIQPFTQPSGYVFYRKSVAKEDGDGGADRDLADLDTFNKDFSKRTAEGQQVKAVGVVLTKELVEVQYHALMRQHSHEVDVAMRTQYGFDVGALGDFSVSQELAWEVDRQVMDDVVTFAATNPRGVATFDPSRAGTYDNLTPDQQNAYDRQFLSKFMTGLELEMVQDVYVRPGYTICGLNVAKIIARTPEFTAVDRKNNMFDQSTMKGSLINTGAMSDGRTIWLDPQMDPDEGVIGHVDQMDPFYAGYIMSPFGAASLITAAFMDPDVLMEKRSQAVAFAKKGVRAGQFRKFRISTS